MRLLEIIFSLILNFKNFTLIYKFLCSKPNITWYIKSIKEKQQLLFLFQYLFSILVSPSISKKNTKIKADFLPEAFWIFRVYRFKKSRFSFFCCLFIDIYIYFLIKYPFCLEKILKEWNILSGVLYTSNNIFEQENSQQCCYKLKK